MIVLTAVVTGLAHLGPWGIGGAVAVVWVVVAVIEYSLSHPREPKEPTPLIETLPEPEPVQSDAVRVIPRTPDPVAAALEPEPVAVDPEPVPVEPEPQPVMVEPEPEPEPEPVRAEPAPEPEPELVEPEPILVEPQPEPEPEPEPVPVEAAPEPDPPQVEIQPAGARAWNVWELDRALRDTGAVTEEQEFLLIYLRDYAGPDGSLPVDFDALVRESFGDVLGTPTG